MAALPTISVVVPNYNGGATLAATLQSLLDQGYPRLEILVADGGSTDESPAILQRFAPHLAWWVSEKDRGQCDAINKGFAHATGEIVNWLCSDDQLAPGALATIGRTFAENPTVDVVLGAGKFIYQQEHDRVVVRPPTQAAIDAIPLSCSIAQPSCFYRRTLLARSPAPLLLDCHYSMDLELWAYFKARNARWMLIPDVISVACISGFNKTSTGGVKAAREYERVYRAYCAERISLAFWYRSLLYPLDRLRGRQPSPLTHCLVRAAKVPILLALAPFYGGFRRVRSMNWSHHV